MDAVPERVEAGDFVGEEFDHEHDAGGGQHPIVFDQGQIRRQMHVTKASEHADDEHGGIQADTTGPGQARRERHLLQLIHIANPRAGIRTCGIVIRRTESAMIAALFPGPCPFVVSPLPLGAFDSRRVRVYGRIAGHRIQGARRSRGAG